MRRKGAWLVWLLGLWALAACQPLISGEAAFDRRGMLENIATNLILPSHEAFAAEARGLDEAARAFRADPTPATLDALQAQWIGAAEAWKRAELFDLGPIQDSFVHNQLDKWPPDPRIIEALIAGDAPIDEALVAGTGSLAKGLPAIEYLVFDLDGNDGAVLAAFADGQAGEQRGQYLVATTATLRATADALLRAWSPSGENYLGDFVSAAGDGGDVQGSFNMLANQLIILTEEIARMKLGEPLGFRSDRAGEVAPFSVEAYRSRHSIPLMVENVQQLQRTFNGHASADGLGFDDYLRFLNNPSDPTLAGRINEQFERTLAALRAIPQPLSSAVESDRAAVERAYQEVRALVVLLKVDMVNQLGVTLTFSDSDGD